MTRNPKMTRMHFEFIASVISELDDEALRNVVAAHFARELKRTNGQFKTERFLTACGIESMCACGRNGKLCHCR